MICLYDMICMIYNNMICIGYMIYHVRILYKCHRHLCHVMRRVGDT